MLQGFLLSVNQMIFKGARALFERALRRMYALRRLWRLLMVIPIRLIGVFRRYQIVRLVGPESQAQQEHEWVRQHLPQKWW
jgi:hypothetical protein